MQNGWLQLSIVAAYLSDASEGGYSALANLRIKDLSGFIHCLFVMEKTRNAPLKFVSILRQELQAAVLSTHPNKMLREELDLPVECTKY